MTSTAPVILFDVFKTLLVFDGDHVTDETFPTIAAWLADRDIYVDGTLLRAKFEETTAIHLLNAKYLYATEHPDVETLDVWRDTLEDLNVAPSVYIPLVADLAHVYREATTTSIGVWPGTIDMLEACSGFRLAIASNTQRAYTERELKNLGLWNYFESVTFSSDAHLCKPDARLFERALSALDVDASEVIYVGDNPFDDVLGAQNAGMAAILLDRGTPVRDGVTLPTPYAVVAGGDNDGVASAARRYFATSVLQA